MNDEVQAFAVFGASLIVDSFHDKNLRHIAEEARRLYDEVVEKEKPRSELELSRVSGDVATAVAMMLEEHTSVYVDYLHKRGITPGKEAWKDHEVISAMAMFAGHMMIESMFDDRIRKLCTNAYYRLKEQLEDTEDISKAKDIKIAMEGKLGALITSDACKFLPAVKFAAKHYKDRKDGKA